MLPLASATIWMVPREQGEETAASASSTSPVHRFGPRACVQILTSKGFYEFCFLEINLYIYIYTQTKTMTNGGRKCGLHMAKTRCIGLYFCMCKQNMQTTIYIYINQRTLLFPYSSVKSAEVQA